MYIVLLVFVQIISTTHRANSVSSLHTLAIDKGTVVAILPQNKALRQYQAREIVNPPNPMLYPSLINTQTHDTLALLNGLTNGFSLIKWLPFHIEPTEMELARKEFVYRRHR